MSALVVDTSVTAAWCFEDETTAYTESVLDRIVDGGALVPGVWPYEMANVIALAERRGRLELSRSMQILETLKALPIVVDHQEAALLFGSVVPTARAYGLTAYDAAYLELALRSDLPLATNDRSLRAAAVRSGVAVLGAE